ncbi:MAG: hypothetical protein J6B77_03485, partial [Clostridia bacterium]|nr:hypothetical protein [Clostridia bacterium]
MNPLHTEFKRKFAISMYKNMGISLGEMSFFKDFVNDTRGDPYPLTKKSSDCVETVSANRYRVSGGSAERVFCQFFPFATYEMKAEALCGEAGFVFRLPDVTASVTLNSTPEGRSLLFRSGTHTERLALPEAFTETSPWLVSCRPGFFDVYYRQNDGAIY